MGKYVFFDNKFDKSCHSCVRSEHVLWHLFTFFEPLVPPKNVKLIFKEEKIHQTIDYFPPEYVLQQFYSCLKCRERRHFNLVSAIGSVCPINGYVNKQLSSPPILLITNITSEYIQCTRYEIWGIVQMFC